MEKFFTPPLSISFERQQALSLLIRFILISSVFAFGYFGFSFITGFVVPRYLMLLAMVLFMAELLALKFGWLSPRATAHFFVIICWLIIDVLTLASGAIHSFVLPWISLIPVMALVLLSRRAAWLWSIVGLATVIGFLFLNPEDFIPGDYLMPPIVWWIASLHVGLQFLMLVLTYIFSAKQEVLINTIEKQNHELRSRERLIEKQHKQLQLKNEDLESEVEKRTKELVRNNQQLEQFNFIASHNLRAPIARILGLAHLLETPINAQDDVEMRQKLIQSTRDLDQVVRDLNTILSIRKGNEVTHTQFSLAEEINQICLGLEKEIESAQAAIRVELNNIDDIHSIRPYVHSVLSNLVSNALRFKKPNEQAHILIQANRSDRELKIEVQDNGIGMDLNRIQNKIFTLYSRFHTHVEGRGLGLYLVKTQLEVMGGKIEVNSKPNMGTTFTVFLPHSVN